MFLRHSIHFLIILATLAHLGSTIIIINQQPPMQPPPQQQQQHPQNPAGPDAHKGNTTQRAMPAFPRPPPYPQNPGQNGRPSFFPQSQNARVNFVPLGALLLSAAGG